MRQKELELIGTLARAVRYSLLDAATVMILAQKEGDAAMYRRATSTFYNYSRLIEGLHRFLSRELSIRSKVAAGLLM